MTLKPALISPAPPLAAKSAASKSSLGFGLLCNKIFGPKPEVVKPA